MKKITSSSRVYSSASGGSGNDVGQRHRDKLCLGFTQHRGKGYRHPPHQDRKAVALVP